jgi:hypothetical protein
MDNPAMRARRSKKYFCLESHDQRISEAITTQNQSSFEYYFFDLQTLAAPVAPSMVRHRRSKDC